MNNAETPKNFFDNEVAQNLTQLSEPMVKIFELTNNLYLNAIQQNWDLCATITPELNKLITSYSLQQAQNFNQYEKNLFTNLQRIFVELNERIGTQHASIKKLLDGFTHAAQRHKDK